MQYRFFRKETNQWEGVEPVLWQWEAHYIDGTILKQYGDDGIFHQVREINQKKMRVFKMVHKDTKQTYTILWHPARKLIHFYRTSVLNNGQTKLRWYCFGYETSVNGVNHKVIFVILHTNEVIATEDVNLIKVV